MTMCLSHLLNQLKKHHNIILCLIIVIQSLFILYQDSLKRGYHIDEIYSYGLANCPDGPFLNCGKMNQQDRWTSGAYFHKYLVAQKNARFNYKQVYVNQTQDVHPPFYYMVLHTTCSCFPEIFSKWPGLLLNLGFFIATQLFLYLLSMEVSNKNFERSLAVLILYGGTMAAVNTATFIRMYMLLTMLSTASLYFHIHLLNKKFDVQTLAMIWITTFLGCMTQYYFLILSFFIAVVFCFTYLYRKLWKKLIAYATTMGTSVSLMMLSYPAMFEHLFGGRRVGNQTLQNLLFVQNLPKRIFLYFAALADEYLPIPAWDRAYICLFILLVALFAFALAITPRKARMLKETFCKNGTLQLYVLCCFTYITISLVAFGVYSRYMYFLCPIISLLACICLRFVFDAFLPKIRRKDVLPLITVLLISVGNYVFEKTDYLCDAQYKNAKIIEQYKNCSGLFFVMPNFPPAITHECGSLMKIKEVYCTTEKNTSAVNSILNGRCANNIVVWIDTSKYWSSGYDSKKIISEIKKQGGYSQDTLLYSHFLADCYLVKR